jgi:glycosyltransferase involved in cell wall biosynthesis
MEYSFFKTLEFKNLEYLKSQKDYPIIQAVQHDLTDYIDEFSGSFQIALTFADRKIPSKYVERSKKFDVIVAGSEWCRKLLEENKVPSTTILQGIDPCLFNKTREKKQLYLDDFLVFSGGKFEHRKGQDLAIKAYKVLQDRHPDVKLVCSWYNGYTDDTGAACIRDSKIDMDRVIALPLMANYCMPMIYQNTDVGIFASRCEAGTNLVMMEYMACGKPAIATVGTGQADLINEKTGIPIKSKGILYLQDKDEIVSHWEEPDLDHLVESLEFAYKNRSKIKKLGDAGAKLMKNYTWETMANKILALIP